MRLSLAPSILFALLVAGGLPAPGRQARPGEARPTAPAPKGGAKPAPVKAPTDSPKTDLKPEVAAQANVRSQMLKQRKKIEPKYKGPKTDLNGAPREALMKLPDVTAALADKIIAGRPYLTKAHLITHDVIPYAVYDKIKDRVVAVQAKTAAPRKQ
ncbi:MAG: hypothetical protein U0P81_04290 [Holophagaceae bacterium]